MTAGGARPALARTVLLATVGAAFITVAAVAVLTLWANLKATGHADPRRPLEVDPLFEVRDKLVWVVAVLAAGGLAFTLSLARVRAASARLLESWPVVALTVVGTAGVAASAAWVDAAFGLGPLNLALGVLLVPVLVLALLPASKDAVRFLWPVALAVGGGLYLPSLVQTPRGLYDAMHAARNIDELLGPVAGNLPLSDYVPQYGGLLGLPLAPFRPLVADHVEWSIMAWVSLLSIVTVVALVVAAALMLPPGKRALAPLLVVPVLLMKPSQPEGLLPAGLQRLFQTIPERSLLPVLLAVVLLLAVARPRSGRRWVAVGAIAGAAALNNFESGVPATVAAVLVVIAMRAGWRAFGLACAGWVGFAVGYVALVWVTGGPFRPEYLVAFSLEFAGGFAQLPMPPYGNYVLVLFVLVAGVASAFPVLWRGSAATAVAAAGGFYFGCWGLLMFPYYVGRSSSLGQLQFFLIPASVIAVWLLVAAVATLDGRRPTPRLAYPLLLACLPAAVFATTVIKAPSPELTYKRLTGEFAPAGVFRSTAWVRQPVVNQEKAREIKDLAGTLRQPVGLFFTSGNVASLKTGLPNSSVLAVPEEMLPRRPWSLDATDPGNVTFRSMQCRAIEESDVRSVIAEELIADVLDTCSGLSRGRADDGMVVFTRDAG
ncbi:hypothetical protein ACOCJ4_14365 [Knoellia sp. CPCC 206435]|uniref:hypothetical protein n=1 Tax=Knoellia terrae TaxID=3404797 RepID=UPI003B43765E